MGRRLWTAGGAGALPLLFLLTRCTGEDAHPASSCGRNEDCKADERCDLPSGKCVPANGNGDGGPNDPDASDGAPNGPKVIVLGQPDEYSNVERELGLSQPIGVSLGAGKLVVGEYGSFRALVYDGIPTASLRRPDVVVGQPNLRVAQGGGVSAQNIYPGYFCGDPVSIGGGKLLVADANYNRTLVWNVLPTTDYRAADLVLGQTNFTTSTLLPASASTMNVPCGASTDGTHLFVAENSYNRVLVWDTFPTVNGAPAARVLGQVDLSTITPGDGSSCPGDKMACLWNPSAAFFDGTSLWVADYSHNRVLKWNTLPAKNNQPADVVVGQSAPDGFLPNQGGAPSASTLAGPRKVFVHGGKLFVTDQANNRVLIWNTLPTANNAAASVVLGQPDFTSNSALHGAKGPDAKSLSQPLGVVADDGHVLVADTGSNRVLVWNTGAPSTFADANVVIGKPDMTATRVRAPSATAYTPTGAFTDGTRFMIGEMSRILVWDHLPTGPDDPAQRVLGADDFTTVREADGMWSPTRFNIVQGMWSDATKLVAVDTFMHRVLVWTKPITANNQPADLVLGQSDFTKQASNEGNRDRASAKSVSFPVGVTSDGQRLAIADSANNRVLIWSTFPTSIQQPADLVLGQAALDDSAVNRGGAVGADTLNRPTSLHFDGTRFYVGDLGNNRVLIWKTWPTADGQPADVAIGQPDRSAGGANNGGLSAKSLSSPVGIVVRDGKLYVGDRGNNRILRFDTIPDQDYEAADGVYGQPSFTSGDPNNGGLGAKSLFVPSISGSSAGRVWIYDSGNARIVGLPVP